KARGDREAAPNQSAESVALATGDVCIRCRRVQREKRHCRYRGGLHGWRLAFGGDSTAGRQRRASSIHVYPCSDAHTPTWVRVVMTSLFIMLAKCRSAVDGAITSASAIWRLVRPRPTRPATSSSREVSEPADEACTSALSA